MAKLERVEANRDQATPYEGGKGKALCSRTEGLEVIQNILDEEGGTEAEADHAVLYENLRALVADEFVRGFEMNPDGSKKTAGDRLGGHGLLVREVLPKGKEVVFVALAAKRAKAALLVLRGVSGKQEREAWESLRCEWKAEREKQKKKRRRAMSKKNNCVGSLGKTNGRNRQNEL